LHKAKGNVKAFLLYIQFSTLEYTSHSLTHKYVCVSALDTYSLYLLLLCVYASATRFESRSLKIKTQVTVCRARYRKNHIRNDAAHQCYWFLQNLLLHHSRVAISLK